MRSSALADSDENECPPEVFSTDPQALVINSFSKYFSMTGWRLGWAISCPGTL